MEKFVTDFEKFPLSFIQKCIQFRNLKECFKDGAHSIVETLSVKMNIRFPEFSYFGGEQ
jgi:hypothetical protein